MRSAFADDVAGNASSASSSRPEARRGERGVTEEPIPSASRSMVSVSERDLAEQLRELLRNRRNKLLSDALSQSRDILEQVDRPEG